MLHLLLRNASNLCSTQKIHKLWPARHAQVCACLRLAACSKSLGLDSTCCKSKGSAAMQFCCFCGN